MNSPATWPVSTPDPAASDPAALARIWRQPMLRFARLHLHEDAVQDALMALLSTPAATLGQAYVRAYLFGILKHKITDRLRRQYRQPTATRNIPADTEADELDALLFNPQGHWQHGAAPAAWHTPEASLQS